MSHDFFLLIRDWHLVMIYSAIPRIASWVPGSLFLACYRALTSVSEDFRLRHSALLDDAYCTYQLSLPGSTFRDMAHTHHVAYFHILSVLSSPSQVQVPTSIAFTRVNYPPNGDDSRETKPSVVIACIRSSNLEA